MKHILTQWDDAIGDRCFLGKDGPVRLVAAARIFDSREHAAAHARGGWEAAPLVEYEGYDEPVTQNIWLPGAFNRT